MDKEWVEPIEERDKALDHSDFLSRLRKNYLGTPSIVRTSGSTGKHIRRVLKKAASLSCSFGLFGLSGLFGCMRLTRWTRQTR